MGVNVPSWELNVQNQRELEEEHSQDLRKRDVTPLHRAYMPHESDDIAQWLETLKQTKARLDSASLHEEELKIKLKEM